MSIRVIVGHRHDNDILIQATNMYSNVIYTANLFNNPFIITAYSHLLLFKGAF